VARDGIEPPTPAFSGLDSFKAIAFNPKRLSHFSGPNRPVYWDSNGTTFLAGRNCLTRRFPSSFLLTTTHFALAINFVQPPNKTKCLWPAGFSKNVKDIENVIECLFLASLEAIVGEN